jgi:hypothetical protein
VGDLDLDGKIILESRESRVGWYRLKFIWLTIGTSGGPF